MLAMSHPCRLAPQLRSRIAIITGASRIGLREVVDGVVGGRAFSIPPVVVVVVVVVAVPAIWVLLMRSRRVTGLIRLLLVSPRL